MSNLQTYQSGVAAYCQQRSLIDEAKDWHISTATCFANAEIRYNWKTICISRTGAAMVDSTLNSREHRTKCSDYGFEPTAVAIKISTKSFKMQNNFKCTEACLLSNQYLVVVFRLLKISFLVVLLSPAAWGALDIDQESQLRKSADVELIAVTSRLTPLLEALGDTSAMSLSEYLTRADEALDQIETSVARLSAMEPKAEFLNNHLQYVRISRDVVVHAKLGVGEFVDYNNAKKKLTAAELQSESPHEYIRMQANLEKREAYKRLIILADNQTDIRLKFRMALSDLRHATRDLEGSPPGAVIDLDVISRAENK